MTTTTTDPYSTTDPYNTGSSTSSGSSGLLNTDPSTTSTTSTSDPLANTTPIDQSANAPTDPNKLDGMNILDLSDPMPIDKGMNAQRYSNDYDKVVYQDGSSILVPTGMTYDNTTPVTTQQTATTPVTNTATPAAGTDFTLPDNLQIPEDPTAGQDFEYLDPRYFNPETDSYKEIDMTGNTLTDVFNRHLDPDAPWLKGFLYDEVLKKAAAGNQLNQSFLQGEIADAWMQGAWDRANDEYSTLYETEKANVDAHNAETLERLAQQAGIDKSQVDSWNKLKEEWQKGAFDIAGKQIDYYSDIGTAQIGAEAKIDVANITTNSQEVINAYRADTDFDIANLNAESSERIAQWANANQINVTNMTTDAKKLIAQWANDSSLEIAGLNADSAETIAQWANANDLEITTLTNEAKKVIAQWGNDSAETLANLNNESAEQIAAWANQNNIDVAALTTASKELITKWTNESNEIMSAESNRTQEQIARDNNITKEVIASLDAASTEKIAQWANINNLEIAGIDADTKKIIAEWANDSDLAIANINTESAERIAEWANTNNIDIAELDSDTKKVVAALSKDSATAVANINADSAATVAQWAASADISVANISAAAREEVARLANVGALDVEKQRGTNEVNVANIQADSALAVQESRNASEVYVQALRTSGQKEIDAAKMALEAANTRLEGAIEKEIETLKWEKNKEVEEVKKYWDYIRDVDTEKVNLKANLLNAYMNGISNAEDSTDIAAMGASLKESLTIAGLVETIEGGDANGDGVADNSYTFNTANYVDTVGKVSGITQQAYARSVDKYGYQAVKTAADTYSNYTNPSTVTYTGSYYTGTGRQLSINGENVGNANNPQTFVNYANKVADQLEILFPDNLTPELKSGMQSAISNLIQGKNINWPGWLGNIPQDYDNPTFGLAADNQSKQWLNIRLNDVNKYIQDIIRSQNLGVYDNQATVEGNTTIDGDADTEEQGILGDGSAVVIGSNGELANPYNVAGTGSESGLLTDQQGAAGIYQDANGNWRSTTDNSFVDPVTGEPVFVTF